MVVNETVRILVVDDHDVVYNGIKMMLFGVFKIENIFSCSNGNECMELLKKSNYDIIILDVNLPETDTQHLLHIILQQYKCQKVIMFSMSPIDIYARRFLRLGAKGYINKSAESEELVKALNTVLHGQTYISSEIAQLLADDMISGKNENVFESLSEREFEILSHLLKGHGGKEIAQIMNLHTSTIGTHKSHIFEKLGVSNLIELKSLAELHQIKL